MCDRIREIFETDCDVYFVFTGTAANSLALAQMCQSFREHYLPPEFPHADGRMRRAANFLPEDRNCFWLGAAMERSIIGQIESAAYPSERTCIRISRARSASHKRRSSEQFIRATKLRRSLNWLAANQLFVHMDGARFANAIASLNCAPKAITWEAGVDVLCFGGTKNGTAAGELVIFFNKEISREFDYRVKQAGQLGSKMRFLAAPWLGLLTEDVWLRNARHANRAARELAQDAASARRRSKLYSQWRQMRSLRGWTTNSSAASKSADGVFTNLSSRMFIV